MVTAERHDHIITRNTGFLKRVEDSYSPNNEVADEEESEYDFDNIVRHNMDGDDYEENDVETNVPLRRSTKSNRTTRKISDGRSNLSRLLK